MAAKNKKNDKEVGVGVDWEDTFTATKKMGVTAWGMRPTIIGTVILGGLAVLAMWGVNSWNPLEGSPVASSIWESFFAVFGLMYALIAGLFLVECCRRRNELSSIISSEVNAIGDIHDCLGFFGNHSKNRVVKKNITKELRNYVELMDEDWDAMEDPRSQKKKDKDGRKKSKKDEEQKSKKDNRLEAFPDDGIRPVIKHVCKLTAKGQGEEHALGIICNRVCEITTYRTNRRDLAQHGLSSGLYLLIPFMSVVVWVATLLLPVANDWVHGFIVFATTVALISLFLLLSDADHPFSGLFCIHRGILHDLRRKLKSRKKGKPPKVRVALWRWLLIKMRWLLAKILRPFRFRSA